MPALSVAILMMTRVGVRSTGAISWLPTTFIRDSSNSTYGDMDVSSILASNGISPGSNLDGWFRRPSPSPSGSTASGGSGAAGRGSDAGSSPRAAAAFARLPSRMCRATADRQLEVARGQDYVVV